MSAPGDVATIARVVVVEDNALMRAATTARLDREPDIDVVGEASGHAEAMSSIEQLAPDIVVLDLRLGDSAQVGVDLAAEIGRRFPEVRVLVYSAFLSSRHSELLRFPNVWGYVLKTWSPRSVVEAVRVVARGERYQAPGSAGTGTDLPR